MYAKIQRIRAQGVGRASDGDTRDLWGKEPEDEGGELGGLECESCGHGR